MFSWSKRIIRKMVSSLLDISAVVILAGLGLFCLEMLRVLYLTHLGQVILSLVGLIIGIVWACHRVFTKKEK